LRASRAIATPFFFGAYYPTQLAMMPRVGGSVIDRQMAAAGPAQGGLENCESQGN